LKTGPTANIFVGTVGNQYIGIEGASVGILTNFCGFSKERTFAHGISRLSIPGGKKTTVAWIYRYMLAGERNPKDLVPFEELALLELILLHHHCVHLQYDNLKIKTEGRIRYKLRHMVPGVITISNIATSIPPALDVAANSIARLMGQPLAFDYTPYMEFAKSNEEFRSLLEMSIRHILQDRTSFSRKYYGRRHPTPEVVWAIRYYSCGPSPRVTPKTP
ncbi:uncharacterized protein BDR25DRAFT_178582, partial [Lindgomyces ingoldianus]